jgi:thiamine monophosphate synthase
VRKMGFAGCAVLGAVWEAASPVEAFVRLRDAL